MIDNSKEYICCAAYKLKEGCYPPNMQKMIDDGRDPRHIYRQPHDEAMTCVMGWRHPDIIWKFKDIIDEHCDSGGFMTSLGRYVDRKEGMKIAIEAGQVSPEKGYKNGKDDSEGCWLLYSEDIY